VRFRVSDVFLPSAEDLIVAPETEMEGTIVNFSDSGTKRRVFAVIEVVTRRTVVVSVEKLKEIASERSSES
jgi:hypothetical protein